MRNLFVATLLLGAIASHAGALLIDEEPFNNSMAMAANPDDPE